MEEYIKMDLNKYEKTLELGNKAKNIIAEKEEKDREFQEMKKDRDLYLSIVENLDKDMTLFIVEGRGNIRNLKASTIGWLSKDKAVDGLLGQIRKIKQELEEERTNKPIKRIETAEEKLAKIPKWIQNIYT